MNYVDFFNIISNQLARVAPDLAVPDEFERVAVELSKTTSALDLDVALVEPFRGLAGPKYEKLLWSIYQDAQTGLKARIGELDAAKAAVEQEHANNLRVAQENEAKAVAQIQADREALANSIQQITLLQKRIEDLENLK